MIMVRTLRIEVVDKRFKTWTEDTYRISYWQLSKCPKFESRRDALIRTETVTGSATPTFSISTASTSFSLSHAELGSITIMSSPSGSLEDADPGSSRASPHKSRFSVDDAFEDEAGELGGDKFEFSTEVIREELEKNLQLSSSLSEDAFGFEDIQLQPSFDPDASVSTIDINAPSHTPDSLPQSPPPVEHVSPEIVNFSHEILPTNMTDDGVREGMHQAYPSVVIDLTKTPDSQVIVNASASFDQPQEPSDSNDPEQPSEELKKPQGTSKADNSFPASQSLPSPNTPRTQTHRPTKSSGPSALEKVISKTRPSFLPPKAKFEDNKHLADWEAMMKQSREAGS